MNTKKNQRIGFKKILYACDFCGKDVVADCVIEVEVEASTVPVLTAMGDAYIWHRCKESDVVDKQLKEQAWGMRNKA